MGAVKDEDLCAKLSVTYKSIYFMFCLINVFEMQTILDWNGEEGGFQEK